MGLAGLEPATPRSVCKLLSFGHADNLRVSYTINARVWRFRTGETGNFTKSSYEFQKRCFKLNRFVSFWRLGTSFQKGILGGAQVAEAILWWGFAPNLCSGDEFVSFRCGGAPRI